MQQRPTVVTVFGILNIVFGASALICIPIGLIISFGLMQAHGNPILDALQGNRVYVLWTLISSVLGILAATVKITAGIGLLKLQAWARITSIGYAIYAICIAIVSMIMTAVVMVPLIQQSHPASGPEGAAAIGGMIGGIAGGIGGSCIALIYPILLLIFMTRPKVKAAFVPQV